MSRSRYRFGEDHSPHFMTATVVAWLPVFSYPFFAEIVLNSWRFLQRERSIDILAFVIMENHLHWIAVGPELGKRVGEFKSFTASSIIEEMQQRQFSTLLQEMKYYKLRHKVDQTYQLWQEGSHPQVIETDEVMWQKIEYIHNNPLRRGYVDDPLHWRYSSAGLHEARVFDRCLYGLEVAAFGEAEPRRQCVPRREPGNERNPSKRRWWFLDGKVRWMEYGYDDRDRLTNVRCFGPDKNGNERQLNLVERGYTMLGQMDFERQDHGLGMAIPTVHEVAFGSKDKLVPHAGNRQRQPPTGKHVRLRDAR